jgi:acetyl esterase
VPAASGAHHGHQRRIPPQAKSLLCYPVLDFGHDTESARLFDGLFHSINPGAWAEKHCLAGQPVTAYAAPLRAASLAGLPHALVICAGHDLLRDDARAYAARMDADGADVTHVAIGSLAAGAGQAAGVACVAC